MFPIYREKGNPKPIFTISIIQHTPTMSKTHSKTTNIVETIVNTRDKSKHIKNSKSKLAYMYKFHNSHFVYFINFVFSYIYFYIYIYIYIYIRISIYKKYTCRSLTRICSMCFRNQSVCCGTIIHHRATKFRLLTEDRRSPWKR